MEGRIPMAMTVMPEILQTEGENKRELSVCLSVWEISCFMEKLLHIQTEANNPKFPST